MRRERIFDRRRIDTADHEVVEAVAMLEVELGASAAQGQKPLVVGSG
jgi:hypothetical protein